MADKTTGLKILIETEVQKALKDMGMLDQSVDELAQSATALNQDLGQTEAAAKAAGTDLKSLGTDADKAGRALDTAGDRGERGLKEINQESKKLSRSLDTLENDIKAVDRAADKVDAGGLKSLVGVVGGVGAAVAAKEVIMLADGYTSLDAKVKIATDSSQEMLAVNELIYAQSQDTRTLVKDNTDFYAKYQLSLKDVGVTSLESINTVDLLNKAHKVYGSTVEESSAFNTQFVQSMGKGKLEGDELKSMLEANSYFMSQLAKAIGVTTGQLKDMGANGELTTDKLREAFPRMREQVEKDFAQMPVTIQEAVNTVVNAFGRIINEGNKSVDGTGAVADAIVNLGIVMEQNKDVLAEFFAITVVGAGKAARGIAGLTGGINTVLSGAMSTYQLILKAAKKQQEIQADIRESMGLDASITRDRIKEYERDIEAAGKSAEDFGLRAIKAFDAMSGKAQESSGKTTEALKKELLALEAKETKVEEVAEAEKQAAQKSSQAVQEISGAYSLAGDSAKIAINKRIEELNKERFSLQEVQEETLYGGKLQITTYKQVTDAEKARRDEIDQTLSSLRKQRDEMTGVIPGLERVGGVWQQIPPKVDAAENSLHKFADASGNLETEWRNVGGIWREVLPDGTVLMSNMTDEIGDSDDTIKKLGSSSEKTAEKLELTGEAGKKAAKEALKEYKKLEKQLDKISKSISEREGELEAELRAMARSGMTAANATKAIKEEAEAATKKAKELAEAGNYEGALKAADAAKEAWADVTGNVAQARSELERSKEQLKEAREQYKELKEEAKKDGIVDEKEKEKIKEAKEKVTELKKEVKENGKALKDEKEALKEAMDGVKASGELGIEILEKQKSAAEESRDALDKAFDFSGAEAATDDLIQKQIDAASEAGKIGPAISDGVKTGVDAAIPEVARLDTALDEMAQDRTATITITERTVQAAFHGGQILRDMRAGAKVSGPTGYDSVHALLAGDEAVTQSKRVNELGYDKIFRPLNSGHYDTVLKNMAAWHGPEATREILAGYLIPPALELPAPLAMPQDDSPAQVAGTARNALPQLGTIVWEIGSTSVPVQIRTDHAALVQQELAKIKKGDQLKARAQGRRK